MELSKLSPVAFACKSRLELKELLLQKSRLGNEGEFAQLFDHQKGVERKLLGAYLNAVVRKKDKIMRSREVSNEMLALLSGQMNITKAIDRCGIKSSDDFVIFCTSQKVADIAKSKLKLEKMRKLTLVLDQELSADIAIVPLLED